MSYGHPKEEAEAEAIVTLVCGSEKDTEKYKINLKLVSDVKSRLFLILLHCTSNSLDAATFYIHASISDCMCTKTMTN